MFAACLFSIDKLPPYLGALLSLKHHVHCRHAVVHEAVQNHTHKWGRAVYVLDQRPKQLTWFWVCFLSCNVLNSLRSSRAEFWSRRRRCRVLWSAVWLQWARSRITPAAWLRCWWRVTTGGTTAMGSTGWVSERPLVRPCLKEDDRVALLCSVSLTDMYVKDIQSGICAKDGEPVVEKESGATALVDGKNLLGPVVGNFCMDLAIKKAKEVGIGWVVAHGGFRVSVKSTNCRRKIHDRNRHRVPIVLFRFQPLWNRWTLCNVGSEGKHDCKSGNIFLIQ